jgi:uncharacterized membrane protein YgcG
MKKILILALGVVFLAGFVSADYTGQMNYMENHDYNIYIDESAGTITFIGVQNQLDVHVVSYTPSRTFTHRINHVWFDGWFDSNFLFLNDYVGTGTVHSGVATEVNPGVWEAEVTLPTLPFFGIPFNLPFTVQHDTNTMMATAWPVISPQFSLSAPLIEPTNLPGVEVAGYSFVGVLMESRLIGVDGGSEMIEVEEWSKVNHPSLSPRWSVPLTYAQSSWSNSGEEDSVAVVSGSGVSGGGTSGGGAGGRRNNGAEIIEIVDVDEDFSGDEFVKTRDEIYSEKVDVVEDSGIFGKKIYF